MLIRDGFNEESDMEDLTIWTEDADVKRELLTKLRAGEVTVVFTKKDGTKRTMRCTLKMDLIPEEDHPSGEGAPGPENVLKVYDLNKDGWRSFIVDTIISIDGHEVAKKTGKTDKTGKTGKIRK